MQEEDQQQIPKEVVNEQASLSQKKGAKAKRDIFRFNGERPTAINLEHTTHMFLEGKKITFNFYSTSLFIELENESAAASVFEILLNSWAQDVVE